MITFAYRSTSYLVYGSTLPLGKALPASRWEERLRESKRRKALSLCKENHSQADLIWWDGTFNNYLAEKKIFLSYMKGV
jgi:hypothetical protein